MKKVIIGIAVLFVLSAVYVGVEVVRAQNYMKKANAFRQSASVGDIRASAQKLNTSIGLSSATMYCDIKLDKLLPPLTEEYMAFFAEDNRPETVINTLHGQVDKAISEAPTFNSFLGFIPKVRDAKNLNNRLSGSMQQLSKVTILDERSVYCLEMVNTLTQSNFILGLQSPENVRKLHPGQLDMYRSDSTRIKQLAQAIKPPDALQSQHDRLIAYFTKTEIDLKQSTGSAQLLSTAMAVNVGELQKTLDQIKAASADLASRPSEITQLTAQL